MASKLSPATPRQKLQRASGLDADRGTPAAKTGASIFGDSSPKLSTDRRSPRPLSAEKRAPVSRGAELHQVQEELAKTKEQLALMEKSKSNILQDLARSRRQVDDLTAKLQEASDVYNKTDRIRSDEMELSLKAAEDWQMELDVVKKQYETAVLDLQMNKQAMENLKHELIVCIEAKDEAVRLAGEAMNAAESTAKRVEELSAELLMAKGQMLENAGDDDLMICNGHGDPAEPTLLAAMEDDLQVSDQAARSDQRLEKKLQEADAEIQKLRLELSSATADYGVGLQKAMDEASGAKSEVEALKQELAVAMAFEAQVNDAKSKIEELELELDAVKGNELQKAEQEVKAALSAIASLKQELALAQGFELQLKEAMSRVEKLRFELDASKETERTFESELADMASKLEQSKTQLADSKEAERNYSLQVANMKSMVNQLNDELASAKQAQGTAIACSINAADVKEATAATSELEEAQRSLVEMTLEKEVLVSSLESLQTSMESNTKQLAAMEENEARLKERVEALTQELTLMKEGNARDSALLRDKITSSAAAMDMLEAECARQKNELVQVAEKESIASARCADLMTKLELLQEELAELRNKEMVSSEHRLLLEKELELCRIELSTAKQSEAELLSKIESLSKDLETGQSEIVSLKEREADMDSRLALLKTDMEISQQELVAMKEKESSINVKVNDLSAELERNYAELCLSKENQSRAESRVEVLLKDLQGKQMEVAELNQKYASADVKAASLLSDLEQSQAEIAELKKKEFTLCAKASALSVVLASLKKENEDKAIQLAERELVAKSEEAQLAKTKLKLEEAIVATKAAREDADKIQISLQLAIAEKDQAMQHAQKAEAEATRNQEDAKAALAEAEAARDEARKAKEAARLSEMELERVSEEVRTLKGDLQAVQEGMVIVKREREVIREELEAVKMENQKMDDELEQERKAVGVAKGQIEALKMEIMKEKEQAKVAGGKIEAAMEEAKVWKEEARRKKKDEEEALIACKTAEGKLEEALEELARVKLQESSQSILEEAKLQGSSQAILEEVKLRGSSQTILEEVKLQGSSQTILEEKEDKESIEKEEPTPKELDSGAFQDEPIPNELNSLKRKLRDTEEQLALALSHSETSTQRAEKLQKDLESARSEKDAHERALVEIHQLLAETEKAKTNMEAEIQRLLDGSKQWHMAKDAIDIPVHNEAIVRMPPTGDCREDKPQPDTVEDFASCNGEEHDSGHLAKVINDPLPSATATKEELEDVKDEPVSLSREDLACSSLKKEDAGGRDQDGQEVASTEELSSLPTKRKKKTLFVRLGTLLEKKKH